MERPFPLGSCKPKVAYLPILDNYKETTMKKKYNFVIFNNVFNELRYSLG